MKNITSFIINRLEKPRLKKSENSRIMKLKVSVGCRIPSIIGLFMKTSFAIMSTRKTLFSGNHMPGKNDDAQFCDSILRPSPNEGGSFQDDHIGELYEFVPGVFPMLGGAGSIQFSMREHHH
jgi:hypothetical protein